MGCFVQEWILSVLLLFIHMILDHGKSVSYTAVCQFEIHSSPFS